jgi:hypothetical protein
VKTPEEVLTEIAARLRRTWSQVVTGDAWAPQFRLGTAGLTGRRLAELWPETHRGALCWEEWAAEAGQGVQLDRRPVAVHGTRQSLPAILTVNSVDVAARLIGEEWVSRLARARARRDVLAARFPMLDDSAAMLRATDTYADVDFELLCRTAAWFAAPHPAGLTARQVPVEGIGTKWLDARESLVRRLAGVESLELERGRPPRVHLTYLDPTYLAAGGRRHDVATVGDLDTVAYRPGSC